MGDYGGKCLREMGRNLSAIGDCVDGPKFRGAEVRATSITRVDQLSDSITVVLTWSAGLKK
jgi:hypothetical protein